MNQEIEEKMRFLMRKLKKGKENLARLKEELKKNMEK